MEVLANTCVMAVKLLLAVVMVVVLVVVMGDFLRFDQCLSLVL